MRGKRTWCEDISPTLRLIKSHKNHKKSILINGVLYERIGGDMIYNSKNSLIEKLV
jgi:hypothetical protein